MPALARRAQGPASVASMPAIKEAAMSWQDAHRYNEALRTAEHDLNESPDGRVQWRDEYADIFGTEHTLLLALRTRWVTTMQAQLDRVWDIDGSFTPRMRELLDEHPGLVRARARFAVEEQGVGLAHAA